MGDPKKLKKKYKTPRHPWQASRINEEREYVYKYGIKSKKEIWKAASKVRTWRQLARKITEMRGERAEKAKAILLEKLQKLGVLGEKTDLEHVLELKLDDVLDRRLQTQLFKKGLSTSVKQARQFIIHQKVMVNDKIVTAPSYIVKAKDVISLTPKFQKQLATPPKKKEVVEEQDGKEE